MFTDFAQGQTFTSISNIQSVCVNMERSWLRDLQIDLISPSGQKIALEQFGGQTGGEIDLGMANDCDSDADPVPGVGADYCWAPTAVKPDCLHGADHPIVTSFRSRSRPCEYDRRSIVDHRSGHNDTACRFDSRLARSDT